MSEPLPFDGVSLLAQMRAWGRSLGFSQIGIADIDLSSAESGFLAWLDNGFAGTMDYMAAHGLKRSRPAALVPGTVRVVTARLDYLPRTTATGWQAIEWRRLDDPVDEHQPLRRPGERPPHIPLPRRWENHRSR